MSEYAIIYSGITVVWLTLKHVISPSNRSFWLFDPIPRFTYPRGIAHVPNKLSYSFLVKFDAILFYSYSYAAAAMTFGQIFFMKTQTSNF